jgi:signal peptidase I
MIKNNCLLINNIKINNINWIFRGLLFGLILFISLNFILEKIRPIIIFDISLPYHFGLGIKYNSTMKLKDGDIIAFKKYFEDKYIPENAILTKYIACNEGEELEEIDKVYYCNNSSIPIGIAKETDSKGIKVNNFKYNGIIPENKIFVMGTSKNSYDSRYFGFIDKNKILYKVIPLF